MRRVTFFFIHSCPLLKKQQRHRSEVGRLVEETEAHVLIGLLLLLLLLGGGSSSGRGSGGSLGTTSGGGGGSGTARGDGRELLAALGNEGVEVLAVELGEDLGDLL